MKLVKFRNSTSSRYILTDSISVINAIREYVQGVGANRRINLPPRGDIMVHGRPLEGIAFDVHNFTDGVENVCINLIRSIRKDLGISQTKFGVNNLRQKIILIESIQDQTKINMSLDKILSGGEYKGKVRICFTYNLCFYRL